MTAQNTIDKAKFSTTNYTVEIDGIAIAAFSEVTGVNIECKPVEIVTSARDSGGSTGLLAYPGVVNYGDITLKMGKIVDSSVFYDWLQQVVNNEFRKALRNGSIVQLPHHQQIGEFGGDRWDFINAFPTKWEIANSGAGSTAVVIETLTLKVCTELKRN